MELKNGKELAKNFKTGGLNMTGGVDFKKASQLTKGKLRRRKKVPNQERNRNDGDLDVGWRRSL